MYFQIYWKIYFEKYIVLILWAGYLLTWTTRFLQSFWFDILAENSHTKNYFEKYFFLIMLVG